jgi:large subunit ribosomal protein L2
MPVIQYKPNRSARREASVIDRSSLYKGKPWKQLVKGRKRISGRGTAGKITIRHRGGGAKRLQREVDFGQDKLGVPAKVERLEYDPNRTAWLALLCYVDGERRYVLAWDGAKVGDRVVAAPEAPEKAGNRLQLKHVTPGGTVFNVELRPGRGGKMFRAAGTGGVVMDIQEDKALLSLPSGEIRLISKEAYGTFGRVSNVDWWLTRIGSAGRARHMGQRPEVRGKVMNPVDHPHGGGEGAQPIGLKAPKTKWGKPALGVKTRPKGKYSDRLIVERRRKKKR